jgi:hypothetical protein
VSEDQGKTADDLARELSAIVGKVIPPDTRFIFMIVRPRQREMVWMKSNIPRPLTITMLREFADRLEAETVQ